jgi:hypothetical protein
VSQENHGVPTLTTAQEYIDYYMGQNFKKVKDSESNGVRNITLRIYTPELFSEVTLKVINDKVFVTVMRNGEIITE